MFSSPTCFPPIRIFSLRKFFRVPIYLSSNQIFSSPNDFIQLNLSYPNVFLPQMFYPIKSLHPPNVFIPQIFHPPNVFIPKCFPPSKCFHSQMFSPPKFFPSSPNVFIQLNFFSQMFSSLHHGPNFNLQGGIRHSLQGPPRVMSVWSN